MLISDDIDECQSDPCINGGTCVDDIARYDCICQAGYTSTNCESNILFVFVQRYQNMIQGFFSIFICDIR